MKGLIYIFILLTLSGCIDEINLNSGGEDPKLVIDGWLSNDPELSYIKIYYSAPYVSGKYHLSFGRPLLHKVYVEALHHDELIHYTSSGSSESGELVYKPSEGIIFNEGHYYRLNIELRNGNKYQSAWQEVISTGLITEIDYELFQKTVFLSGINMPPIQQPQHFLDLKATIYNSSNRDYGYYIKSKGIEELMTFSTGERCECTCYLKTPNINEGINVVIRDAPSNSIKFSTGSIPMSRLFRYHIDINIYTISADAAGYLALIAKQQNNTGSIFDPAPFKLKGNIQNMNNEEEEVLGNFFIANHSSRDIMINRAMVYYENRHVDIYRDEVPTVGSNCLEYYPNASIIKPSPFRN